MSINPEQPRPFRDAIGQAFGLQAAKTLGFFAPIGLAGQILLPLSVQSIAHAHEKRYAYSWRGSVGGFTEALTGFAIDLTANASLLYAATHVNTQLLPILGIAGSKLAINYLSNAGSNILNNGLNKRFNRRHPGADYPPYDFTP